MLETNRQGKRFVGDSFYLLDDEEFESFVGLLLRGVDRSAGKANEKLCSPAHGQVMSVIRLKQIRGLLRFDNTETHSGRLVRDKLSAVRLPFDNFVSVHVSRECITMDEQLQYMHSEEGVSIDSICQPSRLNMVSSYGFL